MSEERPWLEGVQGDQVRAIIEDDRPVLRVAAGPGTGKTFGLRKRVLRLLHPAGRNLSPDRVLVCAFNRVIAEDLRKEITDELERYGLQPPVISTVHSLAASLIDDLPRMLLPHEQEAMIYDIREMHPDIDEALGGTQAKVTRALREHQAGLTSHPALWTAVDRWLTKHSAGLVGELPRQVESRLRGGDFADQRFDEVIIDEFQDLTEAEARLAIGLQTTEGQLVVLGDRKQSIYAFRGNEGRGLQALGDYVGGPIIDHLMDECRRCHEEIVDLANDVMAYYNEPLANVRGPGAQVHVINHNTPIAEHERMAQEIARVYREFPDQRHLVLVTRRQWGYDIRNALQQIAPEIIAQTVFSEDILETWPAREAFLFLSLLGDPQDPVTLRDWVSYKEPDREGKKWKAPKRNAPAYLGLTADRVLNRELVLQIAERGEKELSGQGRRNVLIRIRRLRELLESVPDVNDPQVLVAHVLEPNRWISEGTEMELAHNDIGRLRREADRMLIEEDGMDLPALVQNLRYRIATREPLGEEEQPDVKIVTLWGAKGLTAEFVYIIGLCDEALPGAYDEDSTGLTEDEHRLEQLRLLYVSLTRAKRALVISRPRKIRRGEVPALGLRRRWTGGPYWQTLHQSDFFSIVTRGNLPNSVPGGEWEGVRLAELPE